MEDKPETGQIEDSRTISKELPLETNLKTYREWEDFRQEVDCDKLYGFLCLHHEHVFTVQVQMEEYLKRVFVDGGTAVVDRDPETNRTVGFADGRPQESSYGKMFVISEVTSERRSFQSIATLLAALIEQHTDCEAALFSLPLKTEGDQRRAKIYQRIGFRPDERFHSVADPERVCYTMPMGELKQKLELLTRERR